jgi:ribosomal protein L40E
MDARFYASQEINIPRLATDLENVYRAKGYQTQQFGNADQTLVQLKKGGDFEAIIGMQAALSVTLQRTSGGVLAMIGQQRWLDKAAVGAVGIIALPVLWPLALTAGVGAVRQASLANEVLNVVDGLVRQQQPGIQIGPIPPSVLPQVQQQWAPPGSPAYGPPYASPVPTPAPGSPSYVPPYVPSVPVAPQVPPTQAGGLRCPTCNTPYEPGDTFCSGCGRSLKLLCPNCKAELKPDASFCPKCGTSTFQTRTQSVRPAASPAPSRPAPSPAAPTLPAQPLPPAPSPSAAPRVQPEPYATSVPKEPPVIPKPTVTFIPAAPASNAAAPTTAQPAAAESAAASVAPTEQTPVYQPPPTLSRPAPSAPSAPSQPIKARPVSGPRYDPSAPWGRLIFQDGHDLLLVGERLVVGRYDHDLGGLKPDIDLGGMEHADTVSRVHALLEHIGSTFTVTDLNSTNATRLNGKRLEPDKATPINDGDSLHFGKVSCTFKKV